MIKAFIIAAMTADGKIARTNNQLADWTSKEDKKFFVQRTKEAGVIVMGANTYETIGRPMPGRLNIVYARDKTYEGVEVTTLAPADLLHDLEQRGYKEVAICGGTTIYTMFMQAGLVDKLYLTIEPVLFGQGLGVFNQDLDAKLQLASFEKLSDNVILLEYDVNHN